MLAITTKMTDLAYEQNLLKVVRPYFASQMKTKQLIHEQ